MSEKFVLSIKTAVFWGSMLIDGSFGTMKCEAIMCIHSTLQVKSG